MLYLFKLFRLSKLFSLLDPDFFRSIIKSYYAGKLKRALSNPGMKIDQKKDNNNIIRQIMLTYLFRVVRLILIIFTLSYFIGTLWYIFVWQISKNDPTDKNFFRYYSMDELKDENKDIDR